VFNLITRYKFSGVYRLVKNHLGLTWIDTIAQGHKYSLHYITYSADNTTTDEDRTIICKTLSKYTSFAQPFKQTVCYN